LADIRAACHRIIKKCRVLAKNLMDATTLSVDDL